MTGKQLLELLQNTTTFTENNGNKKEKSLENYRFCMKKENGWPSDLTIEQVVECTQIYIVKIDLADGTIELKIDDEAKNDKTFTTIEDFLKSIEKLIVVNGCQSSWKILFCSENIPIEITVKTARGNENIYLFGTNMDVPGKKKPYGWNRVKNLIVEEITEINSCKKFVLRIAAREQ